MTAHELAHKLLEPSDIEVRCLGNTEEFGVDELGDWNREFVYVTIHHCEVN